MVKEIKTRAIDEDVLGEVKKNDSPPRQIHYNGEQYFLESDSAGYFYEVGSDDDGDELMSWEYFNEAEDKIVCVTRWDDHNIEAAAGDVLQLHQITDILPGS